MRRPPYRSRLIERSVPYLVDLTKRRREALGLSPAEIARRLSTNQSVVSEIERAVRPPSLLMLLRYMEAVDPELAAQLQNELLAPVRGKRQATF